MVTGRLVLLVLLLLGCSCFDLEQEVQVKADISGPPEPGSYKLNFVLPVPGFVELRNDRLVRSVNVFKRATIDLELRSRLLPSVLVLRVGEKWVRFEETGNELVEEKKDATAFVVTGVKQDEVEGFVFASVVPPGKQLGTEGEVTGDLRLVELNSNDIFLLTKQ